MKIGHYIVKAKYKPEEVLPFMGENKQPKEFAGVMVSMDSHRYRNFVEHGCTCLKCGIVGSIMVLERSSSKKERRTKSIRNLNGKNHFNLYAVEKNGNKVMMTKDHIVPKSEGGKNHVDNYQVLCTKCNQKKGSMSNDDFMNGNYKKTIKKAKKVVHDKNYIIKRRMFMKFLDGLKIREMYFRNNPKKLWKTNPIEYISSFKWCKSNEEVYPGIGKIYWNNINNMWLMELNKTLPIYVREEDNVK